VFELARDSNRFDHWSQCLKNLSQIVSHEQLNSLIQNPRITRGNITELVLEIGGEALDEQAVNLVKILGHYRRFSVLPAIAEQFELLRAEAEGVIDAELEVAFAIDPAQLETITQTLQQRLGRKVRLKCKENRDLIGGAVIRAGDWVVDGSLRAQLAKLSSSLGI